MNGGTPRLKAQGDSRTERPIPDTARIDTKPGDAPKRIRSYPFLVGKELTAALICIVALGFLSALWDAPIGPPADPAGIPQQDIKAPWIFLGIQFMLRHMDAFLAGIVVPAAAVIFVTLIPYIPEDRAHLRTIIAVVLAVILIASCLFTVLGYVT